MTICSGYGTMKAPCCGAHYSFPTYSSMNFNAAAYWSDGWSEKTLMPEEDGLRHCKCGQYVLLVDMDEDESQPGYDLPEMKSVSPKDLPDCIAKASSVYMEIAARRSYWKHLNHAYRQRFKSYKRCELPELTEFGFELSGVQKDNLERLLSLFAQNDAMYAQASNLLERAEIHRELGQFDLAQAMLDRLKPEDVDDVAELFRRLSHDKQSAPWRFKWSSGWPAKLIC